MGFVLITLISSWSIKAQEYFSPVDSTGLPYQVIFIVDSITGYELQTGDEIGLFSDTLCVGADAYSGIGNFAVTAWEGSQQYYLPGFANGDSIRAVVWADLGNGMNEYEVDPVYVTGDGTFGYGSYSSCYFNLISVEPDLEVSETEHDFGYIQTGEESDSWSFVVRNIGSDTLDFDMTLSHDSAFVLSYDTTAGIPAQDSLIVNVNFFPLRSGLHIDTVFVSNSMQEGQTEQIILMGTGTSWVVFTKPDSADWTLEENQDRISDNVWITRKDIQSLFNIAQEDGYSGENGSPVGTLWADTSTAASESASYTNFVAMHGGNPHSLIGDTVSLYLSQSDSYYDVLFISFTGGNSGGGFSYLRNDAWLLSNQSDQILNEFSLSNNYPNPFNPTTTFSYQLSNTVPVSFKIIDLTGKTIRTINEGLKPSGQHTIQLDASNLSSGIYFCVFNAGNFQKAQKIMVMK